MDQRQNLQLIFEEILGSDQAFFQSPEGYKMLYPAIVYNISDLFTLHADNNPYHQKWQYEVTVMDRKPDSVVRDKVAMLPECTFSRFFTANQLNHFVFNLYF